jgi:hypothetical protein
MQIGAKVVYNDRCAMRGKSEHIRSTKPSPSPSHYRDASLKLSPHLHSELPLNDAGKLQPQKKDIVRSGTFTSLSFV